MPTVRKNTGRREMELVLREETMGLLGLCHRGSPYVLPMTYGHARGALYMHCAPKGRKVDAIRENAEVCFTVARQYGRPVSHPQGARCPANHDSVICYGTARIVEDMEERRRVLTRFNRCLEPGAPPLKAEDVQHCLGIEIKIQRMTGRRQRKGGVWTRWDYTFPQSRGKR